MTKVRRKYEVHKVPDEDKTPRKIVKLLPESKRKRGKGGRDAFEISADADERDQFDVFYPNGHSIRVVGAEGLHEIGLSSSERAGLVDMETGEEVDEQVEVSLRDVVSRKTRPPRRSAA